MKRYFLNGCHLFCGDWGTLCVIYFVWFMNLFTLDRYCKACENNKLQTIAYLCQLLDFYQAEEYLCEISLHYSQAGSQRFLLRLITEMISDPIRVWIFNPIISFSVKFGASNLKCLWEEKCNVFSPSLSEMITIHRNTGEHSQLCKTNLIWATEQEQCVLITLII